MRRRHAPGDSATDRRPYVDLGAACPDGDQRAQPQPFGSHADADGIAGPNGDRASSGTDADTLAVASTEGDRGAQPQPFDSHADGDVVAGPDLP